MPPWAQLSAADKLRLIDSVVLFIDKALAAPDYAYWRVFSRKGQWCYKPDCTGTIQYSKDGPNSLRGFYYLLFTLSTSRVVARTLYRINTIG